MARRLLTRDGRREVWQGNSLIAYVDPDNDILYIIDDKGHAFPTIDIWKDAEIMDELDRRNAQR